jgi:hypothetical protein
MKTRTYLSAFFSEKAIPYQVFEIADANGLTHHLDTDVVVEAILNASIREQMVISATLRKLDYHNQSIQDYLFFLAQALVKKFD